MNPFKNFDIILKSYISDKALKELPFRWSENHRFYHTTEHLEQIIKDIENNIYFRELNIYEKHALLLAAFFHDIVYDPKRKDNEDKSINFFISSFKERDTKMINTVCDLIETTKYRKRPFNKLQRIFWDADNAVFKKGYDEIIKKENLIRKEYYFVPKKEYKEKRIEFFKSCLGLFGKTADKDINKAIEYVKKIY